MFFQGQSACKTVSNNIKTDNINKELEEAVYQRNLEKVKALLSSGADVNFTVGQDRDTLLHHARSAEIVKELLLWRARINATNMYREIPLHYAVTKGWRLEAVRELLKHGADVNARDRKGNTPLHHAVKQQNRRLEIIKELLEYGADINIRNCERRNIDNHATPLRNALGREACVNLLIKYTLVKKFSENYRQVINLDSYKDSYDYQTLSSYVDNCVCEILQMKTEKLKEDISLYELVTKNFHKCNNHTNQLSTIIHCRLGKIDYSLHYPIYFDIISDRIKPFLERANLLEKLGKVQIYTELDSLDQDIKGKKVIIDPGSTYNISKYLSNNDLSNVIIAFDESNEFVTESLSSVNNLVELDTKLYESCAASCAKRARLE